MAKINKYIVTIYDDLDQTDHHPIIHAETAEKAADDALDGGEIEETLSEGETVYVFLIGEPEVFEAHTTFREVTTMHRRIINP